MTTIKWPIRSAVLLLVAITAACGSNPGGPDPVTTPTPKVSPVATRIVQATRPFEIRNGTYGFGSGTWLFDKPGTLELVAIWAPIPPDGQVYLFLLKDQDPQIKFRCYDAHDGFKCPDIIASDMGDGQPKRVRYHLEAGQQTFLWVVAMEGRVNGEVQVWFTPDN